MNPPSRPDEPIDYNQPVAYDTNGRPLYAHPPDVQPITKTEPVRSVQPTLVIPASEAKQRNEESRKAYPMLNLTDGEYVISEIRRHPIGLVPIIAAAGIPALLVLIGLLVYSVTAHSNPTLPPFGSIFLPGLLVIILCLLGGYIAVTVYTSNRFILTNESVIQEIQTTLFTHNEQTVSLGSIEDASYVQTGIFGSMFDFGTIRLSTRGAETTYLFQYVSNPKKQIALINNTVESFKNGHIITDD